MEVNSKIDEINEFRTGAGGSPKIIINIAEGEMGNGARISLEQSDHRNQPKERHYWGPIPVTPMT